MAVQFGIASMHWGGIEIGILQGVTIDFSFDSAMLYKGGSLYPVDTRTHTAEITGNAEFADINAVAFEKILGASRTGAQISVSETSVPDTFEMQTTLITDGITFKITFPKCRGSKLSLAFQRDQHFIPNFDFTIQADSTGAVATIDVGDIS